MKLPKRHTNLEQLLHLSEVRQRYDSFYFFSAYYPNSNNPKTFGIELLSQFRLLHPDEPVLFLSFLPQSALEDEFCVLQLPCTSFMQLPCSQKTFLNTAQKLIEHKQSSDNKSWEVFAQKAGSVLLQKKITMIRHSGKLAFTNKVGLGLGLALQNILSYPEHKDVQTAYDQQFDKLLSYIAQPEIQELITLSKVGESLENPYLKNVFQFCSTLKALAQNKNNVEVMQNHLKKAEQYLSELKPNQC